MTCGYEDLAFQAQCFVSPALSPRLPALLTPPLNGLILPDFFFDNFLAFVRRREAYYRRNYCTFAGLKKQIVINKLVV
jgi:hypothetical protein